MIFVINKWKTDDKIRSETKRSQLTSMSVDERKTSLVSADARSVLFLTRLGRWNAVHFYTLYAEPVCGSAGR